MVTVATYHKCTSHKAQTFRDSPGEKHYDCSYLPYRFKVFNAVYRKRWADCIGTAPDLCN